MSASLKPASTEPRPWRAIAIGVVVCVAIALLYHKIDLDVVRDYANQVNAAAAFALLVGLPLAGFPVSVLHVAAGIRFGTGWGIAAVALSIVIQLLASFAFVKLWRRHFTRWLAPVEKKIPKTAHGTMCLFTMLLPGVPYFAKNYVLPLLGVPFWTYMAWCAPIHIVRSLVAIILGDQSDQLTPGRIAALVLYGLTILGSSWWMWRRLRSQFANQPPVAGGQKQPA